MTKLLKQGFNWIDSRFPLSSFWRKNFAEYYAPKNLNFWYYFGAFSLLVLANQIITGIWMSMFYIPTGNEAFSSVENTMRYVNLGWLIRYMHSTGASAFFVVIYLHIYRCIMYGSYRKPRELLWLIGVVLYILLMAEAYTGYVLPWGQMSFWASRVISAIIMAIPFIGGPLAVWFIGDYSVSSVTLHRFFSYHATGIPLIILLVVLFHLMALRKVGSNNPDGIEIKDKLDASGKPLDGIPFHPYFVVKDLVGIVVFIFICALIIFYFPTFGGLFIEPENYVPSNPLKTPLHIAPAWYLAPFYAILRAIPNKLFGIIALASSIAVLFVLPWLDKSPVKSIRYKGTLSKIALTLFVISFIGLGYFGTQPVDDTGVWISRIFTVIYFLFFLLMPFYTRREKTKLPPERVTQKKLFNWD
ncbi:MAG: cytochrome b N-terminal domain-containing protein [Gammaproteobacteria bacterium]|nr:cytochrome b N-terminal domain-containing protein [Gammaproteobacteria bacterium]